MVDDTALVAEVATVVGLHIVAEAVADLHIAEAKVDLSADLRQAELDSLAVPRIPADY